MGLGLGYHLELNLAKTEKIVVDFRKNKSPPSPACISGSDVEIVKYRGTQLDDKLEWPTNMETG